MTVFEALQPTAVPALFYLGWLPIYARLPAHRTREFFFVTGLATLALVSGPLAAGLVLLGAVGGRLGAEWAARAGRWRWPAFALVLALLHAGFWGAFYLPRPAIYEQMAPYARGTVFVLFSGIGLTFFRTASYLWERIYSNLPKLCWADYLAFMLFLPQLRHGPVERAHEFAPRLAAARSTWQRGAVGLGLLRIGLGFATLVPLGITGFVMDRYKVEFDFFELLGRPEQLDLGRLLVLMHGPAIALYLVESSYAAMQLGVSLAYNVVGSENYNRPYLATNPREVWHRWNMTLSRWLRDYCYVPLGGRARRVQLHLVLTFVYAGLLHGLRWNCVVWGLYTGITVAVYVTLRNALTRHGPSLGPAGTWLVKGPVGRWIGRLLTFHWFAIGVTIMIDPDYCGVRVLRRYVALLLGL
ncbi:MAG: MBOAT family O-acyltransferase [Planctomycetota bacterium]